MKKFEIAQEIFALEGSNEDIQKRVQSMEMASNGRMRKSGEPSPLQNKKGDLFSAGSNEKS